MQKSPPSPNYGEIMVLLYWLGEVLDSTPIATYTVIFIQIGQLFRKISSDKLLRTQTVQNHFSRRFGGCSSQIRSHLELDVFAR